MLFITTLLEAPEELPILFVQSDDNTSTTKSGTSSAHQHDYVTCCLETSLMKIAGSSKGHVVIVLIFPFPSFPYILTLLVFP